VLGLWWVNLFSPASPEVGHLTNPTLVSGVKICLNLNLHFSGRNTPIYVLEAGFTRLNRVRRFSV
jgi:hypothetical protein